MAGGPGRVGLLGRVVGPVQVEVGQDFHWIYCLHAHHSKNFKKSRYSLKGARQFQRSSGRLFLWPAQCHLLVESCCGE